MNSLFKCTVCNYIHQGDEASDSCPKCGVPKDKFIKLSEEDSTKIYESDSTNDIHMEIINLCNSIIDLATEGISIDLDPACVKSFEQAINESWVIKQRSKAELENHMKKGKW